MIKPKEPVVMRLDRKPFDEMKAGKKVWEIRINDDKWNGVRAGDSIPVMRRPELEEKIMVTIVERQTFLNVQRLLDHIPLNELGQFTNELEFIQTIMNHYTPKAMNDYGLVAMKVKVQQ